MGPPMVQHCLVRTLSHELPPVPRPLEHNERDPDLPPFTGPGTFRIGGDSWRGKEYHS